jgi:glycosyltransferase involved in cell wall biosynthesis
MRRIKCIHWGHGVDLEQPKSIKNVFYKLEYRIEDALILYAEFLKRYVGTEYHYKVFVANNTLNTLNYKRCRNGRKAVLLSYNITTKKNIVCMGRMQRRKRIGDLIEAFKLMARPDVGLILIGPDTDGVLQDVEGRNIHVLSPMYGDKAISLLSACDVYCLPGHVGLSIVDAFFCGLPIVTENVRHAPEICYFKDGVNGFMVERGDVLDLAQKVELLLDDDDLRKRFSEAAINEIETAGHIDNMCGGFLDALEFVTRGNRR